MALSLSLTLHTPGASVALLAVLVQLVPDGEVRTLGQGLSKRGRDNRLYSGSKVQNHP